MNLAGRILLERFRVDEMLTENDLWVVYRGFDLKRSIPLAIKAFKNVMPRDPLVIVFDMSGGTWQSLSNPHLVPFFGLYEENQVEFVIERFVDGLSLRQVLAQHPGTPVPIEESLVYLKAISSALGYLHGIGLVHCNIQPNNILVDRSGGIQVCNVSFSRHSGSPMTNTGLSGLPAHLAPEQVRGEAISPETDIYGLGILLFELLTGQHPFLGKAPWPVADPASVERLRQAHLNAPHPDPLEINPNLPAGLAQVLLTSIARNPSNRYHSVQEMLEVACAVLSKTPEQIANELKSGQTLIVAGAVAAGTQRAVGAVGGAVTGTMRTPEQAPTYIQPIQGTEQVYYQAAQVGVRSAQPQQYPQTEIIPPVSARLPTERGRPAWIWALIAGVGILALLCIVGGLGLGLPVLFSASATDTPQPTSTYTATAVLLPTFTPIVEQATLQPLPVQQLPASDTPPPPPPQPTNTFPPPPPTQTMPTSFKVTVWNNTSLPLYFFRDNQLAGTDPIPPGKYIYYKGISPGPHYFIFCHEFNMTKCVKEMQVIVDQDMDIRVSN